MEANFRRRKFLKNLQWKVQWPIYIRLSIKKEKSSSFILSLFADSSINFKRLVCAWYYEDQGEELTCGGDVTQDHTDGDEVTQDDVTEDPSGACSAILNVILIVVTVGVTILTP